MARITPTPSVKFPESLVMVTWVVFVVISSTCILLTFVSLATSCPVVTMAVVDPPEYAADHVSPVVRAVSTLNWQPKSLEPVGMLRVITKVVVVPAGVPVASATILFNPPVVPWIVAVLNVPAAGTVPPIAGGEAR